MRRYLPLLAIVQGNTISAFTYHHDISEKAFFRKKSAYTTLTNAFVDDDATLSLPTTVFWSKKSSVDLGRRCCSLVLQASINSMGDKGNDGDDKTGYRFGDITKSLIGGRVEKVRIYIFDDMILFFDKIYHFPQYL